MRRSLYVRSVDVLQMNFVALRCTASISFVVSDNGLGCPDLAAVAEMRPN